MVVSGCLLYAQAHTHTHISCVLFQKTQHSFVCVSTQHDTHTFHVCVSCKQPHIPIVACVSMCSLCFVSRCADQVTEESFLSLFIGQRCSFLDRESLCLPFILLCFLGRNIFSGWAFSSCRCVLLFLLFACVIL